jgi:hypothetical protein
MNSPRPTRAAGWISMPVVVRAIRASARAGNFSPAVCSVGQPVREQRLHAGPHDEDLRRRHAAGRRIALPGHRHVLPDLAHDTDHGQGSGAKNGVDT